MRIVVADTGPLNYLVMIDRIGILPTLFTAVLIAQTVRNELTHPEPPSSVQGWLAESPAWLEVRPDPANGNSSLRGLDAGERAVLLLALTVGADLVLDDRAGVLAARSKGLAVTGTLGLIDLAARRGLLDVAEAVARLRTTSFRCRPELLRDLVAKHVTL